VTNPSAVRYETETDGPFPHRPGCRTPRMLIYAASHLTCTGCPATAPARVVAGTYPAANPERIAIEDITDRLGDLLAEAVADRDDILVSASLTQGTLALAGPGWQADVQVRLVDTPADRSSPDEEAR
jgi:hypothetical protein